MHADAVAAVLLGVIQRLVRAAQDLFPFVVVRIQRTGEKVTRDEFPLCGDCRAVSFTRSEKLVTLRLQLQRRRAALDELYLAEED